MKSCRGWFANGAMAAVLLTWQTAAPKESLLEKLLRIAGLTAAPSQMRGPADEVLRGNIWIAEASGGAPKALTTDGDYRSPVFSVEGAIYALKDTSVVRIPLRGGAATKVQDAPGVIKLVGFDRASADEIVVLLDNTGGSPLGALSLRSGKIVHVPYDRRSNAEQRVLAQARAQERVYGHTTLYIRTETKQGISRPIEWTDVYLESGGPPRNISACDGVSCAQPALSPDGRMVVFIKADE
jgi:hypothetical protein